MLAGVWSFHYRYMIGQITAIESLINTMLFLDLWQVTEPLFSHDLNPASIDDSHYKERCVLQGAKGS